MKSETPAELITELEALEEHQNEVWAKSTAWTRQWADFVGRTNMGELVLGEVKTIQPDFAKAFRNYTVHFDTSLLDNYKVLTSGVTVDPSLWEGLKSLTASVDFSKLFGGEMLKLHGALEDYDWHALTEHFRTVASDADYPEVAEAVEVTAENTETANADIDALLKGLQPMFANLEEAVKATKDSASRVILLAVAAAVIVLMMQATLARFGIHVVPQEPSPQAVPKKASKAPPTKRTKAKSRQAQKAAQAASKSRSAEK